jgi:hypothetical protein
MKKILVLSLLLLAVAGTAQAMAVTDSITLQNCNRSDATCASFLDTSSNGQIKWGGLVAGGLRSLTNFFTDGKVGIGTLRPNSGDQSLRLDVNGAVGAKFYCDENGNHCVAGDQLGNGGGPTIGLLFNGSEGITINRNTTTSAYEFKLDPTFAQRRINGYCDVGQAISKVNQDGTVECQTVTTGATTGVSLTAGTGITLNPAKITSAGTISVNSSQVQSRVSGICTGANAVQSVNQDGTVTCVPTIGSTTNYWTLTSDGALKNNVGGAIQLNNPSGDWSYLSLTNQKGERAEVEGGQGGMFLNATKITFRVLPGYAELMTIDGSGNVVINGSLNVKGTITQNGQTINQIINNTVVNTYKIGEQCGIFTSGVTAEANIPCAGMNLYKGSGDKGEKQNFQCPAKFTLAGGDFQSPGNRYFYTCVRSAN